MLPKHPDLISDGDLRLWVEQLVEQSVEEGPRLDYKEIQALDSPQERREVAKDVSSFANEVGGVILYGIPEDRTPDGRPIPLETYGIDPIPSFGSRVDDILVDAIQPTLPEWRTRTVPVRAKGNKVVHLVWTPESWAGVHMVEAYGEHRYYRRSQYRTVEMTEREVRDRYERILRATGWVDDFLQSAEINYVAALLPGTYRSHCVVCPMIGPAARVDFSSAGVREWLESHPYPGSTAYRPSPYGVKSELRMDRERRDWYPYVELYSNGGVSLWMSTVVAEREGHKALFYMAELENIEQFLAYAGRYCSFIQYSGPIRVVVTVSHSRPAEMTDLFLPYPRHGPDWRRLVTHDNTLRLDVEDSAMVLASEPNRVLKALADDLFRAYGFWSAPCFDDEINLVKPP